MPIKTTKLRDIPDEHLRAIGLVSLHWSAFETMIFRMIWLFSGMSVEDCRALVTHMSFPQRIELKMRSKRNFPQNGPASFISTGGPTIWSRLISKESSIRRAGA